MEMERPTHEVTVVLDNGATLVTDAFYDGKSGEEAAEDILEYVVNDREDGAWKTIGEITAFHRRIVAFQVREL